MILLTVGGQLPFDRLVRTVDEWAGERGRSDVFAQIGDALYLPKHIEHARFLDPDAFQARFGRARVVISHAGMGTVIGALEAGKPIIVMPRRHALKEQRNDHQLATVQHLRGRHGIRIAMDEAELREELERVDELQSSQGIPARASEQLIEALRSFVDGDEKCR